MHHTHARCSDSFQGRLRSYALGATAAGVSVLALTQPLNAKIVYTPANKTIYPHGTNHQGVIPFDLNHDRKIDFSFLTSNRTNGANSWGRVSIQGKGTNGAVGGHGYAYKLGKGQLIGKSRRFAGSVVEACHWDDGNGSYCDGKWYPTTSGYLGLKFNIAGKVHYGWARLLVNTSPFQLNSVTLTGYAYETIPNKSIVAGRTKGPDVITVKSASLASLARGRK